jgi:alginate O-acetyltransferase complex protein AlgI
VVFSSIELLWFFMPVVLLAYALIPPAWRNAMLAVASLVFYAWGAHAIVYVFLLSLVINFMAGLGVARMQAADRARAARAVMWAAIVVDLAILAVWKYAVFLISQLDGVTGWFGHPHGITVPTLTLPIGISFFTFHANSYVVDTHRGVAAPMRRPQDFAQYMAFFPQLIAVRSSAITRSTTRSAIRRPDPSGYTTSRRGFHGSRLVFVRRS